MLLNPEIFKAYDIRGVYGKDFDEEMAYRLGRAFVQLRQEDEDIKKITKKNGQPPQLNIVVGRDMRLSSPELKKALIRGLVDAGAKVIDIGLTSTPTFYFAIGYFGYDGGIMVSASHNPPEYNGFKLARAKALPVSRETGINALRDKVTANKFGSPASRGQVMERKDVLAYQVEHDLGFVNLDEIKPFKVVADPANGMGAQYLEALFARLPCQLVKINFRLDGAFPAHEADPLKEENLAQLKEKVLAEKADLGIATDGDGDRIFFVDNEGEVISPAIVRGLLAMIFLREKPGAKICYDIRPGRITRDLIEQYGGMPVITRVGHSLIKEQAIAEGAYFAGESSGHFFLNMDIGCFEVPMIVILKLLREFSQANKPVAEFIKPFRKYWHSGEINMEVADKDKILTELERKYDDGKINKLDGLSVEYEDWWFNVRPSNTEPKLRLNLEAETKELMKTKRDEILAFIKSIDN